MPKHTNLSPSSLHSQRGFLIEILHFHHLGFFFFNEKILIGPSVSELRKSDFKTEKSQISETISFVSSVKVWLLLLKVPIPFLKVVPSMFLRDY